MGFFDSVKDALFGKKPKAIGTQGTIDEMLAERGNVQGLYADLLKQILGKMEGMGETTKEDIARAGREEKGGADASLRSRGLYSSSLRDATHRRVNEGVNRSQAGVDESVRSAYANVLSNIGRDRIRFEQQYADPYYYRGVLQNISQHNANRRRSGGLLGGVLPGIAGGFGGSFGEAAGGALAGKLF